MPKDTLTITDNRTGKTYEVPIENGCIRTPRDLRQIKVDDEDFGLMGYDPAFLNTANCRSAITFIDGDKGILEYRGYPIEQLAEKSTYLEVAYLLMNGELPNKTQLERSSTTVTHHTYVHENMKTLHGRVPLRRAPHVHAGLDGGGAVRFYPDAKNMKDEQQPPHPDDPADREDADHRGVRATGTAWACRTSTRTTSCPTSATSSR